MVGLTCLVSGDEDLLELGVQLDLDVRVSGLNHLPHEALVLPPDHLFRHFKPSHKSHVHIKILMEPRIQMTDNENLGSKTQKDWMNIYRDRTQVSM